MVGCAAPNCSNSSRHSMYKFYRFPSDPERRTKWLINSRRKDWVPTKNNYLCNVHFEESQFEQHRQDGNKKLKPNAIPTLFNVPNPPPRFHNPRRSTFKRKLNDATYTVVENEPPHGTVDELQPPESSKAVPTTSEAVIEHLQRRISSLEEENLLLKQQINDLEGNNKLLQQKMSVTNCVLNGFLTEEQLKNVSCEKIRKWSEEGIIKGLKIRFALGKRGYNFIRSTGYPAPCYSTLNNHVRGFKIGFGILESVFFLLKTKVEVMTSFEKDCVLMIDEMEISGNVDFDRSSKKFIGAVTLGNDSVIGNHLTVIILRGVTTAWKQIVAVHVTGPSTQGVEVKRLIEEVVNKASEVGLQVHAVVSDMGSNNKALWASFGVAVTRTERNVSLQHNNLKIYVLADVPHLVKNWRSAMQNSELVLPEFVVKKEGLPSAVVSSKYISELWHKELQMTTGLRTLHHLTKGCINPSHFEKMNVGLAVRYLSLKTATALETAVRLKVLPAEALTTAWFIRLLNEWYSLLMSRTRMKSITKRNQLKKIKFLEAFVDVMQEIKIGSRGWKPLNTGSIMSTLSFIELARRYFKREYAYLIGSRFSQDGLENVFSQVRKKAGASPSALAAIKAVKLICLTQFMSPCRNTNYFSDSDKALLEFSNIKLAKGSEDSSVGGASSNFETCNNVLQELSVLDYNNIHYIAGSAVHAVTKKVCENCSGFLTDNSSGTIPADHMKLTEFSDMGGLKYVSRAAFDILVTTEQLLQKHKTLLLSSKMDMKIVINNICNSNKEVPNCCNMLQKLLNHYTTVRGFSICNYLEAKRKVPSSFGNRIENEKKQKL